jgi:hypothetical protein
MRDPSIEELFRTDPGQVMSWARTRTVSIGGNRSAARSGE